MSIGAGKDHIDLNDEEYNLLIEMLFLSNWVINSHISQASFEMQPYYLLEQKILNAGKPENLKGKVEYENETARYQHLFDYQRYLHRRFIDPYENATFWDTLTALLAERDVINEIGMDAFKNMDKDQLNEKIQQVEARYRDEFSKNHSMNVIVSDITL